MSNPNPRGHPAFAPWGGRLFRCLAFCLLFLLLLMGAAGATESIRVDGELVSVGDSKLILLRVMGQPDYQEVVRYAVDTDDDPSTKDKPQKKEIWYYFGVNGLDYSITLINSRIRDIEWERIH